MLIIHTVALLSTALQASSYLLPRGIRDPVDPLLLVARQGDSEDDDYNVATRIGSFEGCSQDQADDLRQAWKDAMMIANAIGDPAKVIPEFWLFSTFFGDYKRDNPDWEEQLELVRGNFGRMQEQTQQSWWRDWYDNRYIKMICGNKNDRTDYTGRGCHTRGVRAHVLRHDGPGRKNDNMPQDTVVFCDSYFDFESTSARVKLLDDDVDQKIYPRNDVEMLKSMGSLLLHELLHTENSEYNPGGFFKPAPGGRDFPVKGSGREPGPAVGAAKVKWFAQARENYGYNMARLNVDNYVYFAIASFLINRYDSFPQKPDAEWPAAAGITAEDGNSTQYGDDGLTDDERNWTWAQVECDSFEDCNGVCIPTLNAICGTEGLCICGNQHPVLMAVPPANITVRN